MVLRNPQLLWLLLLLPALALIWLRGRGRVNGWALPLRFGAVALLIVALADPIRSSELITTGRMVVLVDQSASIDPLALNMIQPRIDALVTDSPLPSTVLRFGADVRLDGSTPDTQGSDLAAALRLARTLIGSSGGRISLFSDGLQTSGDALAEAQLAAAAGIAVDVYPIDPAAPAEVSVTRVSVPRTLRVGEQYEIEIDLGYRPPSGDNTPIPAQLRLFDGDVLLSEESLELAPGSTELSFPHRALAPGIARIRAEISAAEGGFPANNQAAAAALIAPPPRVLIVEGRPGNSAELLSALSAEGIEVRAIGPRQMPTRLSTLEGFEGMVLVDVPATAFSLDQMSTVHEFVRSEGRGLVVVGGSNAYTVGGYKGTPLEDVLPVRMDPPPRPQRSNVAMLLIMDRSASMTAAFGVSKFDMAKEAAILATESLQAEDRIGILGFDTSTRWVVDFQEVGTGLSQAQIQEQILALPSGGGTEIELALAVGLPALAQQPAEVRHAILLTDGRSFTNDLGRYQQLVDEARAANITLSTIAIGTDADLELLDLLARWGGGRYYFAAQPEDIPRLALLESEIARSDPIVEGQIQANLGETHPLMRGFSPAELPQLTGYVGVTPRDEAEVVLRSPDDDPLLAAWQYGLGRAVAWTPTSAAPWANAWLNWAGYPRFWAQTVRYTLPEPDSGPLQVRLDPRSDGADLVIDALQPGGSPLDLAVVGAQVTLPNGENRSFDVRQSAPGRYSRLLGLISPGPYAVSVAVVSDGIIRETQVGYVHPVPAEYRLRSAEELAAGRALLEAIAQSSGGSVATPESMSAANEPATPSEPWPLSLPEDLPIWPWLLGGALSLWVLEIAIRRGLFVR